MTTEEIYDVRRRAAAIMTERPHMKHNYTGPNGAVCLTQAIFMAIDPVAAEDFFRTNHPDVADVSRQMRFEHDDNLSAIKLACQFNNANDKEAVIARLLDGVPPQVTH